MTRKETSARYYQRHRAIIKLAASLGISMKQARAMHAQAIMRSRTAHAEAAKQSRERSDADTLHVD